MLFSFYPQTAPKLMAFHNLKGAISIQQIKIFLLIPAAALCSKWLLEDGSWPDAAKSHL